MYKSGNIVKLKSGGPDMTVDKVNNNKVTCVWFIDNRLKTAIFRKNTLEISQTDVGLVLSSPAVKKLDNEKASKVHKESKATKIEKVVKDHKDKKSQSKKSIQLVANKAAVEGDKVSITKNVVAKNDGVKNDVVTLEKKDV